MATSKNMKLIGLAIVIALAIVLVINALPAKKQQEGFEMSSTSIAVVSILGALIVIGALVPFILGMVIPKTD
jgi:hypothetical protein